MAATALRIVSFVAALVAAAGCDDSALPGDTPPCSDRLDSDPLNCGGCGHVCPAPPHQVGICRAGACTGSTCAAGWGDCNHDPSDGCETALDSVTHCGACAVACSNPPHGAAACAQGTCGLGACDLLWGDCDHVAENGCERGLAADASNCGACNAVCPQIHGNSACQSGHCLVTRCDPDWLDCDGDAQNGCETNRLGDLRNCGACGHACFDFQKCVGGVCQGSWNPTGVQTRVPVKQLVDWKPCWSDTYDGAATIAQIQAACPGSKLLLACRATGSDTLDLLAWAPRADVFFDAGSQLNPQHVANGVNWYFSGDFSWGFAPAGDALYRNSCDHNASMLFNSQGPDPDKRLCWHTMKGSVVGGWRCGSADELNSSASFERLIFQAD